jgi:hypothetical protein
MGILVSRLYRSSPGLIIKDTDAYYTHEQSVKLINQDDDVVYGVCDLKKKTQAIIDKNLRLAVMSHKYDIACVLREKGASQLTLTAEDAKELYPRAPRIMDVFAQLKTLNAQKAEVIFSPNCINMVILRYLNAILHCIFYEIEPRYIFRVMTLDFNGPQRFADLAKIAEKTTVTDAFMVFVKWNLVAQWKVSATGVDYCGYVPEKLRYVRALLGAGADVNANDGEAFLVAAQLPGHNDVLTLLLEQHQRINPNTKNFHVAFEQAVKTSDSPKIIGLFSDALLNDNGNGDGDEDNSWEKLQRS